MNIIPKFWKFLILICTLNLGCMSAFLAAQLGALSWGVTIFIVTTLLAAQSITLLVETISFSRLQKKFLNRLMGLNLVHPNDRNLLEVITQK